METLELAVELRRAGYGDNGERLGFDLYPYTEDAVAAVQALACCSGASSTPSPRRSTTPRCARRRCRKDAVRAYELVYAALGGVTNARRRLVLHERLVGLDVGTTGVKALAITPTGNVVAVGGGGLPLVDAAAGLVGAGPGRLVGARARLALARLGVEVVDRPLGSDARSRVPRRAGPGPSSRDPLERPAHGGRVRRDRGSRRPRPADRADRQPGADRLHRAEAPLAASPRARRLCTDPADRAPEGLRPPAAHRASGRSMRRTRPARSCSTSPTGAGATTS